MSSSDRLMKLKTTVEVYEKELQEAVKSNERLSGALPQTDTGIFVSHLSRVIDLNAKLVIAYREYVRELEKLVPR